MGTSATVAPAHSCPIGARADLAPASWLDPGDPLPGPFASMALSLDYRQTSDPHLLRPQSG